MPHAVEQTSDDRSELAAVQFELKGLVEKRLVDAFAADEEDRYRTLLDREKELPHRHRPAAG
jgi:hypothetical protein